MSTKTRHSVHSDWRIIKESLSPDEVNLAVERLCYTEDISEIVSVLHRRATSGQPLRLTAPPADRGDPELARIATVCSRLSIQPIRYSKLRSMPESVREHYETQIERWRPIAAQRTSISSTAEPELSLIHI